MTISLHFQSPSHELSQLRNLVWLRNSATAPSDKQALSLQLAQLSRKLRAEGHAEQVMDLLAMIHQGITTQKSIQLDPE
jgi:hypothetical protein